MPKHTSEEVQFVKSRLKKSPNAYMLFSSELRPLIEQTDEWKKRFQQLEAANQGSNKMSELGKETGRLWKDLNDISTPDEKGRDYWFNKARELKENRDHAVHTMIKKDKEIKKKETASASAVSAFVAKSSKKAEKKKKNRSSPIANNNTVLPGKVQKYLQQLYDNNQKKHQQQQQKNDNNTKTSKPNKKSLKKLEANFTTSLLQSLVAKGAVKTNAQGETVVKDLNPKVLAEAIHRKFNAATKKMVSGGCDSDSDSDSSDSNDDDDSNSDSD